LAAWRENNFEVTKLKRIFSDETQERLGLIIQPGAVGDLILTLPLVRLLKETCKLDRVDAIGHFERLRMLAGRSPIGRIFSQEEAQLHRLFVDSAEFDVEEGDRLIEQFRKYEWIVTFLADEKGHFERNLIFAASITHAAEIFTLTPKPPADFTEHAARYHLKQFAEQAELEITPDEKLLTEPLIAISQADQPAVQKHFSELALETYRPIVAIHPGSGGEHKCWPLENFLKLSTQLREEQMEVIFLLGPAERERWDANTIRQIEAVGPVLGELPLADVAAVLSCCAGYVGNDSGIGHLAGSMGIPTVTIFGPTDPGQWRPLGPKVSICQSPQCETSPWPDVELVFQKIMNMI
jgi:ADP-heptose:LPS heptosyltransferase